MPGLMGTNAATIVLDGDGNPVLVPSNDNGQGAVQAPQAQPQQGQPSFLGNLGRTALGAAGDLAMLPFNYVSALGSELKAVPSSIAMNLAQRQAQLNWFRAQMQAIANLPEDQQRAALLNMQETGKALASNYGYHDLAPGHAGINGATGDSNYNPVTGIDPTSGRGFSVDASGNLFSGGQQLSGEVKTGDGILYDTRKGPLGTYSIFNKLGPGEKPRVSTPAVNGFNISQIGQPASQADTTAPAPAAAAPTATPTGGPRGIRNNNWGNLKALPNGQMWPGQTGVDAQGFAIFGDPNDGIRAAATNLQSYGQRGLNTVGKIIARWAPASDKRNNTGAYTKFVADQLGVKPNDPLDMTNSDTINKLAGAIFQFENGRAPLSRAMAGQPDTSSAANAAPANSTVPGTTFSGSDVVGDTGPLYSIKDGTQVQGGKPGERYQVNNATGEATPVSGDGTFNPSLMSQRGQQFMTGENYKNAANTATAINGLIGAIKSVGPSTPVSMASIDTALRSFNPGIGVRGSVLNTFLSEIGAPAEFIGEINKWQGKGFLPANVAQQLLETAYSYGESHMRLLQQQHAADVKYATDHGFSENDLGESMPTLAPLPLLSRPDPSKLVPGRAYETPKGVFQWNGRSFVSVGQ